MKKLRFLTFILVLTFIGSVIPGALAITDTEGNGENADVLEQMITINLTGYAQSGMEGENVSLTLYSGTELPESLNPASAVMFDQVKTTTDGYYKFSIEVLNADYVAYIKAEDDEMPRIEYIEKRNYVFYEDFEGYEGGSSTLSEITLKGGAERFTKETDPDGNTYIGVDPMGGTTLMYKYFDNELSEGKYKIDFKFKTTDTSVSPTYLRFMMGDSSKYNKAEYMMNTIRMDNGSFGYYYQSTDFTNLISVDDTYSENEWCEVSAWLDLDKNVIYYFIDGKFAGEEMFNAGYPITGFSFYWDTTCGSKFCIDDLLVKKVSYDDVLSQYERDSSMPSELVSDVTLKVSSENVGNIFYEGDEVLLNVLVDNLGNEDKNLNLNVKIYDYNNELVETQVQNVSVGAYEKASFEIAPQSPKFGTYRIEISDDEGKYSEKAEFSYSVKNEQMSDKYGINVHMRIRRGNAEKLMPLIKNAGFGMTRDQFYWNETADGEHNHAAHGYNFDEYYNQSVQMNMDIMGIIGLTNSKYKDDDSGLATSDEALLALEAYAEKFAAYYKDTVKYIELGNEWNHWKDSSQTVQKSTPEEYYKCMKAAYSGIKKGNPDAVVVGFATANIDLYFIEDVINLCVADAKDGEEVFYPFDAVSVHCYHEKTILEKVQNRPGYLVTPAEDSSTWYRYSMTLKEMLASYDLENMPIYGTELGWYTGDSPNVKYDISKNLQAALYIRNFALNDGYDLFDKLVFYDFQDDYGDAAKNSQHWGIINSFGDVDTMYSAKPAYVAVANYNKLISGAEVVGIDTTGAQDKYSGFIWKEYEGLLGTYRVNYRRAEDNTDIYLLWNTEGETSYTLDGLSGTNKVMVYDMFGNSEKVSVIDGKVNLTIGIEPLYVEVCDISVEVLVNGTEYIDGQTLNTGDVITVNVENNTTEDFDIIISAYNGKRFVDVVISDSYQAEYTVGENADNLKIMLWDENQMPKYEVLELK